MFARTPRLLLRPGWPEDAAALAAAIGDEAIIRNLARAPWPYRLADAEAFLAREQHPRLPNLIAFRRTAAGPQLIGGAGLTTDEEGLVELGYWIARACWGEGLATEAAGAMVTIARDALGLSRLYAGHFVDNPASGRVLDKLGFRPTGVVSLRHSVGRGEVAPCRLYEWEAGNDRTGARCVAAEVCELVVA